MATSSGNHRPALAPSESCASVEAATTTALNADIYSFASSKGLFAGVSLAGATMDSDDNANKALYGKSIGAKDIVEGGQAVLPAAEPLVDLLNKTSPARK